MILEEIFFFRLVIDVIAIVGVFLWFLVLYWGFFFLSEWVMLQFNCWFNFVERLLYMFDDEFERICKVREF